jgi:hypothetical protein
MLPGGPGTLLYLLTRGKPKVLFSHLRSPSGCHVHFTPSSFPQRHRHTHTHTHTHTHRENKPAKAKCWGKRGINERDSSTFLGWNLMPLGFQWLSSTFCTLGTQRVSAECDCWHTECGTSGCANQQRNGGVCRDMPASGDTEERLSTDSQDEKSRRKPAFRGLTTTLNNHRRNTGGSAGIKWSTTHPPDSNNWQLSPGREECLRSSREQEICSELVRETPKGRCNSQHMSHSLLKFKGSIPGFFSFSSPFFLLPPPYCFWHWHGWRAKRIAFYKWGEKSLLGHVSNDLGRHGRFSPELRSPFLSW